MLVVEIEKMYQEEYWVNRYFVTGTVPSDGVGPANNILAAERAITDSRVVFTKYAVRTTLEGDFNFATVPVNAMGTISNGADPLLPLFNVLRVDFQAAIGRPSRKYLRGVLTEGAIAFMDIGSGHMTSFQTNYATVMAAIPEYVDAQGQELIAGVVYPKVGMRQLRRGSKKSPPHNKVEQ